MMQHTAINLLSIQRRLYGNKQEFPHFPHYGWLINYTPHKNRTIGEENQAINFFLNDSINKT